MKAGIESKGSWLIFVLLVALLTPGKTVSGQTIRFFPIRTAPLGSPVGTVGDPVTPTFNESLNCWELKVPGGVEVDIDLQAFGWGDAAGAPTLPVVFATVLSAGYDNGVGAPLNPKGWPGSPEDGAYQATNACVFGSYEGPCGVPFDPACNTSGGFCVHNANWVMPACANDLPGIATPTLDYTWATAAQNDCNFDEGEVKTFGGLILEVPPDAAGMYLIALDPDPNNTCMFGIEFCSPIDLHAACITIIEGACCMDTNSDGQQDSCQNDTSESNCAAAAGSFAGDGSTCSGQVGACCLDGDLDGFDDTCTLKDGTCCFAEGGSFLGAGSSCSAEVGACCLDSDGDGFTDTCKVMNQACCDGQGGSFGAAGSQCSAFGGACCLDDGTCLETNLTCCESQGGSVLGMGSNCLGDLNGNGIDEVCEDGFPAVSEWGLIVMALLLLVGIKICFARRRLGFRAWRDA